MSSLLPFGLDGFFALRSDRDIDQCVLRARRFSSARLYSLFWRWRNADLQSYIPDFAAGEASTSKAIFPTLALASADVQSYLAYFGVHGAPTRKAIFPTLALAKPRLAKLSSIRWRWQTPKCKAIFPTLALGRHRPAKLSSQLWRWATPRPAKENLYF